MPVDYGDQKSLDDFMEQLGYLEGILASVQFDSCICVGEFNVDLEKERPGRFSRALRAFMRDHGLQKAEVDDGNGVQFTWSSEDCLYSSWLDYALTSMDFETRECEFVIDSEGPWNSDHVRTG